MTTSFKYAYFLHWPARVLKYTLYLALVLLLMVSLILVFLPAAVSLDWTNDIIRKTASESLGRPVALGKAVWSWSRGIRINQLVIPDVPAFSELPLASLDHLTIRPDIKSLLGRKIRLELVVSGLSVNVIRLADGRLNINTLGRKRDTPEAPVRPAETKKTDKKAPEPEKEKDHPDDPVPPEKTPPPALPSFIRDIAADIRFTRINLRYEDRQKNETYLLTDLDISLDAVSLKTAPVRLDAGVDISVNTTAIPRSTVSAVVDHLFDPDGTLTISALNAAVDADLPGILADVKADMTKSEIRSDIRLDLGAIMAAVGPLIPGFPMPTDISGEIRFTAQAGTDPNHPLGFDATLSGTDLAISGQLIDEKSIGPGNVGIHLNGILDLPAETLELTTAGITLLDNTRIQASGRVNQFQQEQKQVDLTVSSLYLDLDELIVFGAPFIPETVKTESSAGKKAFIALNTLRLHGFLPTGESDVLLDGLNLLLPDIGITDAADQQPMFLVSGGRAALAHFKSHLTDLFPATADTSLSLAADQVVSGKGREAVSLSGIRLDDLTADLRHFAAAPGTTTGFSGDVSLANQLTIDWVTLPDLLQVRDISQSLKLDTHLSSRDTIHSALNHLDVKARSISLLNQEWGHLDSGAAIHLAWEDLSVQQMAPLTLDMAKFIVRADAENALTLSITANAKDTATTSADAEMRITADMGALAEKLPDKILAGLAGTGNALLSVQVAGRRPNETEISALKTKLLEGHLGFIDSLNVSLALDNSRVAIPRAEAVPIIVDEFSGHPVVSYTLEGASGQGKLTSNIAAGSVTGIPGMTADAPVAGTFSLAADHTYAASIDLNQSFTVQPAGIRQTIAAAVDHLDEIITKTPFPGLPVLIATLAADISAGLTVSDLGMLKQAGIPGLFDIDLDGALSLGALFQLTPDQSATGRLLISANDLDLRLPETLLLETMNANIDFTKSYAIRPIDQQASGVDNAGLSSRVFDLAAQGPDVLRNNDVYRHIRYLHERMNPDPALSFEKADIAAAPFPLVIGESMLMLNLAEGLPDLDYFQFNLLGGTVNGSIALVKDSADFKANTALTFSGINFAQIFPRAFSKEDYSKADISGALYADFPLTDQLEELLEGADITIAFTRIGSRAMERLLYAIDPFENNEAIITQRRILKNGSPKNITLEIKDGFLTLTGSVAIKGIDIALPAIRRLNIARIPGLEKYEQHLSGMAPVLEILQKASAQRIVVDKQSETLSFE